MSLKELKAAPPRAAGQLTPEAQQGGVRAAGGGGGGGGAGGTPAARARPRAVPRAVPLQSLLDSIWISRVSREPSASGGGCACGGPGPLRMRGARGPSHRGFVRGPGGAGKGLGEGLDLSRILSLSR